MLLVANDKQVHVDIAFVAQNDSYINNQFGTPYAEHTVVMRMVTRFEIVCLLGC